MQGLHQARFSKRFPPEQHSTYHAKLVKSLCAQAPQYLFPSDGPILLAYNHDLAKAIGLDSKDSIRPYLLGQKSSPHRFSYNYGGHQFGHWADQLGDGRALVLGESRNSLLESTEIQLKGCGPTPFSRRGDGFAVMRSSVREYLASEMMLALNIPTTGALSLALTGENVVRDKFYDGHAAPEAGALLTRTAPSFLRFGNFELLKARGQTEDLKDLVVFVYENLLVQQQTTPDKDLKEICCKVLELICKKTADLLALWQAVGFVHGVMNTDNMSILGLTIDYGPFGFMDAFDPNYTPNTTDLPGRRYSFGNQAGIAKWNLGCLMACLEDFVDQSQSIAILKDFDRQFFQSWQQQVSQKFGLNLQLQQHHTLVNNFFQQLQDESLNMGFILRELSQSLRDGTDFPNDACFQVYPNLARDQWQSWFDAYKKELASPKETGAQLCHQNPRLLLWNSTLHTVIQDLNAGNQDSFQHVWHLIQNPYKDWEEESQWTFPKPALSEKKYVNMNSCSS